MGMGFVAVKQGCLADRLGSVTATGAARVQTLAEVLGGCSHSTGRRRAYGVKLNYVNLLCFVSPAASAIRSSISRRANALNRDYVALDARCGPSEQSIR